MIIRKTERYCKEGGIKTWMKHGKHDKDKHTQMVKRTTIWLLFIPIFYFEKIQTCNI